MATNFYLESRTDKNGDAPIRVSITISTVRLVTSTGYSINPLKWDSNKQKVKQGSSNAKGVTYNSINAKLTAIESFFIDYGNKLPTKAEITQETIKGIWATNFGKQKGIVDNQEKTLLYYFDMFVSENSRANSWSVSIIGKFRTIRGFIIGFAPKPTFESFNSKGLADYVVYLREVKDLRNTTIGKHVGYI